ncbi:flavin-containing monooxygenase [Nocardioides sp.]|uniref:flavin-containing monooxygenase n=1 Tax=Nocardioides sp. TaxID=35761 RepID=UPI0035127539
MSSTAATPAPADQAAQSDAVREATVVIIGSGFGGQTAALQLAERGVDDVVILERRDFMGGTWCQNSYPGAAVDVQSPLYSLVGEPYRWSKMFAEQAELQEYTEHVIAKHGLREKTVTGANVVAVRWEEEHGAWRIETEAAGTFRAQFLINASGPLSTPVIPPFPGREEFRGVTFHTNNWDHSVDLTGKKVAIIGSGASAAQVIPAIQPQVGELHVFQRSPHWVMPRPDRDFSAWQQRLLGIKPLYKALRTSIYWSLETRVVGFKYSDAALKKLAQDKALKHLERQVPDPELRAKLTPDYTIGCKRIILSNTLYPALSAPNTTLHDRTDGIDHLDATGIVTASGEHLDLDVIVWSTGYDATDGVISYPVVGREDRALADVWAEFPRAYLGTTVPGFPNLFVVTGPNTGIGHTSAIFVIESQMKYVMDAIEKVRTSGRRSIEVTAQAEEDYTAMIHREMEQTVWKKGGCHSWYQSKSGHVIAMFPGFSFTFRRLAAKFKPADHVLS